METLTEILGLSVHDMGNDMEKTIEQHRAEFEKFVERLVTRNRYRDGEYVCDRARLGWAIWKAARGIKE